MLSIEIGDARGMWMKNGKVWINGTEHFLHSYTTTDPNRIMLPQLPPGKHTICVGVGRGKGGFRSKKIKVDSNGSPITLRCSYGNFLLLLLCVLTGFILMIPLLFIPNTFYRLKRI